MKIIKKWLKHFKKHKYACIIIFLTLTLIVCFAAIYTTNKDIGLSVVFKGEYYGKPKEITEVINRESTDLGEIKVEFIKLGKKIKSSSDFSYAAKSSTFLVTNSVDVYLVDKFNYEQLSNKEVLADLSELAEKNCIDKNKLFYSNGKVLGIDVTNSKLIKDTNIDGKDFIVIVIKNTKKYKNVIKFVEQLL